MELQIGTIKNLQKYIASKITERGFEDESLRERLVLLMEEIGELAKACRKISGMNINKDTKTQDNVGGEVADVINFVFAVAIKLGIDMEKEFRAKEIIVDKRIYERSKIT